MANKGMEGLAITPDGRTLVGIVQNALIQDANQSFVFGFTDADLAGSKYVPQERGGFFG